MKYLIQIDKYRVQKEEVRSQIHKSPIILFLMRDLDSPNAGQASENVFEFIFALRPTPDFNPDKPLILGICNGAFGTLGSSMEKNTFCPKPILDSPLSNQLALYLIQELLMCGSGDMSYLENMIITMGDYLVKRYCMQMEINTDLKMGISPFQLQKIRRYVQQHMDRPVQTSELAMLVELSVHHFIRVFKKTTGETPHQFVTRLKLEEAKKLLLSTDESVIQVGMGVGCENPSHFSQLFKSNFGIPPLKFRKAFQANMQFAT
ncbi:helix-turn-helix domain-containing protein [Allomuricauda sp. M10]|uniref:helix-turn-helix domain-containing protein n=1 Tax=Allomuricauda sp. M10 TaxID=2683292 RepID=UPI001D18523B|nr:AraC family transcriptional regulator [Muricauda sp. M10]